MSAAQRRLLCLAVAATCWGCAPSTLKEPSFVLDAAPAQDPLLPRLDAPRPAQDPFAGSCATAAITPERVPLDLFFVVDASGSMLDLTGSGISKWAAVRAALTSFLRSDESAEVSAAMHFFPLAQPGVPPTCQEDTACAAWGPCVFPRACAGSPALLPCENEATCGASGPCVRLGECGAQKRFCAPAGGRCSTSSSDVCQPLDGRCAGREVCAAPDYAAQGSQLVALPLEANALVRLLEARQPEGGTPTGPALAGVLEKARASARVRTGRRAAVVLATDGFPTTCEPRSVPAVARIAAAGASGSPSIPTFMVGVFAAHEATAAATNLAQLADAGGTAKPFIISTAGDVTKDFLAALDEVRARALACEYKIPQAQRGPIDLEQVNVRFLTAGNEYLTIGNVAGASECHATKGGWFYEVDPATRERALIRMCETTCQRLKAEPQGRVDLIIGCKTVRVD